MSNADFDTRNTSPGTRPTTAKPAENGRKHRPSAARSAQPQEIAQRDTPNTTTRHHPRQPKTPVSTGDSLSVQPARGSLQKSCTLAFLRRQNRTDGRRDHDRLAVASRGGAVISWFLAHPLLRLVSMKAGRLSSRCVRVLTIRLTDRRANAAVSSA